MKISTIILSITLILCAFVCYRMIREHFKDDIISKPENDSYNKQLLKGWGIDKE